MNCNLPLQRCATPPFARIMELVVKLSSTTKTPSLVHVLLGGRDLPVLMTLMNVLKTLVKMEANAITCRMHTCVSVLPTSWVSAVKRTVMNALPLHHVRMEETVTTPLETMPACAQTTGWGRIALKMSMSVSIIPARIVEAVKMKLEVITARVWISGQEQTVT